MICEYSMIADVFERKSSFSFLYNFFGNISVWKFCPDNKKKIIIQNSAWPWIVIDIDSNNVSEWIDK